MTGHEFIALAGKLATASGEATLRTAVSRAYYGAFHVVLAFLKELDCPITNDHKAPAWLLVESGNLNAEQAGQLLNDLQKARVWADYKLNDAQFVANDFVRDQVEAAHLVCSQLDKCNDVKVRAEMKAEIARLTAKRERRG